MSRRSKRGAARVRMARANTARSWTDQLSIACNVHPPTAYTFHARARHPTLANFRSSSRVHGADNSSACTLILYVAISSVQCAVLRFRGQGRPRPSARFSCPIRP